MGALPLIVGITAIVAAIFLIVVSMRTRDKEPTGVAGQLETIEKVYSAGPGGRDDAARSRSPRPGVLNIMHSGALPLI